jgi:hypothetical protein
MTIDDGAEQEYTGGMAEPPGVRNVLVIANRTAATPGLLAEVRRRAAEGPSRFTLLVPRTYWDADTEESAATLELAIPLLKEATGEHVDGLIGDEDPVRAVTAALGQGDYDELILSTLPSHVSRWLHMDLPTRLQRFGLPLTVVTAQALDRPLAR